MRPQLDADHVRIQTASDAGTNLTESIHRLTDFLDVVGVVALLLGGIGVASGVTAFVARKIDAAAVLRCLGATGPQVLAIYVTQAAVMGLVGAVFGALLGVAIQLALPNAIRQFLPVDLAVHVVPRAVIVGLLLGLWVSLLFALRPLLSLRRVSPLQALRRDVDVGYPMEPHVRCVTRRRGGRSRSPPLSPARRHARPSLRIGLGAAAGVDRSRAHRPLARGRCPSHRRATDRATLVELRATSGRRQPASAGQSDAIGGAGTRLRRVPDLDPLPGAGNAHPRVRHIDAGVGRQSPLLRRAGGSGPWRRFDDSRVRLRDRGTNTNRDDADRIHQRRRHERRRAGSGRHDRLGHQ